MCVLFLSQFLPSFTKLTLSLPSRLSPILNQLLPAPRTPAANAYHAARCRSLPLARPQHPRTGPLKLVSPAVSYNGARMPVRLPPPWLGQHTEEVLTKDLGYSREKFEELRGMGVV